MNPVFPNASDSPPEPQMLEWIREQGQVDAVWASVRQREKRQRHRRRLVAGSFSMVALLVGLLWAVPYVRDTETIATHPARRQTLALRDGSRAELNAQTELFTDFRMGRRTMRMNRGEAFFAVAKDAAHPFVVETPAGRIQVTGTEFNVRLVDGRAEVTLVEGSVAFAPAGENAQPIQLRPSQQLDSAQTGVRALDSEEIERTLAWRHGRAVFNAVPLEQAVARFAGYHGKSITVAPEVKELRLGGSYLLDNLPGFLGAIQEMLPVIVVTSQDGSLRVFAR